MVLQVSWRTPLHAAGGTESTPRMGPYGTLKHVSFPGIFSGDSDCEAEAAVVLWRCRMLSNAGKQASHCAKALQTHVDDESGALAQHW